MRKTIVVALALVSVFFAFAFAKITIFVIPPIGAIPEGRILVITRYEARYPTEKNKSKFIDSPGAMCERLIGSVNLLCRGMAIIIVTKNTKTIFSLPYSSWLYSISTGGKIYQQ